MADNYLITGYRGEAHVTAENDRCIHAAAFGTGRFVLPIGEQFRAEYIGSNKIRIHSGMLMDNGTAAGIPIGESVDLSVYNAGQGMKRNDLIVFAYTKNSSTLIESGVFKVVMGTETSGTPSDPTLTQNDLLSGRAGVENMPLWRVTVEGTSIGTPVRVSPVVWQNPPMEEGVEYCTSEFFNGKRVYTMLVKYQHTATIGSTTSNTDIEISNVIDGFKYLVSCEVSNSLNDGRYTFPHVSNSGGIVLVESVAWNKITLRLFKRDWAASTWYFRIKYTKD